jgi:hypothetical protein
MNIDSIDLEVGLISGMSVGVVFDTTDSGAKTLTIDLVVLRLLFTVQRGDHS